MSKGNFSEFKAAKSSTWRELQGTFNVLSSSVELIQGQILKHCTDNSGMKWNERKQKPFLSAEVSRYHFEVWGAVVCCMFLLCTLRKFPILFLGGQVWVVRPTHPPTQPLSFSNSRSLSFLCSSRIPSQATGHAVQF